MAPESTPNHVPETSLLPTDGFRSPQGAHSHTFVVPPLDGSLTLHQIYDFHAANSPDHPLFVYEAAQGKSTTLTWADTQRGIHRAVRLATSLLNGTCGNASAPPTIAILANSDTISFQCVIIGLLRAGYQPFPISIRNSKVGVAHMLSQATVKHMFVSGDDAMQCVARDAVEIAAKEGKKIEILNIPTFSDIFPLGTDVSFEPLPPVATPDLDLPAVILHSSGSTAFPKMRTLTHRMLLQWSRTPWFGERDLCGEVMSVHALPLFHASGFFQTCWAPSTGMTLSVFRPTSPPVVLTPDRQLASAAATGATLLFAVPSFMETWNTEPGSIEVLKRLTGLIFGGAPLSKTVGDLMESKGIHLWHIYGATEYGVVTSCMPKASLAHGWEYIAFSPHVNPLMLPQDDPGIFELALVPGPTHTPAVTNATIDGKVLYQTSDLFIQHPTVKHLWKIHGRADDQIMLSTGEKTNPGPLEHIISRSPLVINALMFGRGKFQNGVIIEPTHPFDPKDSEKLSQFRNDIWPYVEQANAFAPTHSRIFKEMIIVCRPDKPFEYTPKRNPRRHVSVALYAEEIEDVYAAVEASSHTEIPPPSAWNEDQTLSFIRDIVTRVMKRTLQDTDDIFEHGGDSLQATWIRNSILHALRDTSIPTAAVGPSFVFMTPTILSLAHSVAEIAHSTQTNGSR